MARYTGPKTKIARKFGDAIFGFDKNFEKRSYPPGQHGVSKRRKTQSEYSIQLVEKQKAKYTYGLLERQFRKLFEKAARKKGVTGENLLKFLEARLDNTVYRLGFSASRMQARQLVSHKHVTVNGEVVNIPSFQLKPGDKVALRERSKNLDVVQTAMSGRSKKFSWLVLDEKAVEGTFLDFPERDQIPENINEQLIVELYSK
ncbi:MAG: 30S ribosomal protein S4 [Chitinophagales bacterium]|nr:30S ribosomal protein S4 [Chitinophagales bacterium]MCO5279470.1 30S ribosomal protein S4 [Chitinophagales bacterium]OJV24418.1 MAG: 30S ribosomal protein S4 [Bacteroidetes bacterium 37-13]HRN94254.1 30S ribosomal protein S4 [Chitinophagales bacterium]HRP39312.1 30S ribosomal protein S4 [Chitinophagales bacterium]